MSIIPSPIPEIFVFIFGLFVGSFLNVCIWRLPAEEQVVKGRSHCRGCGHTISWHDNVPLVSYVALGAKCRFCKEKISPLYPAVELGTGILFLGMWLRFGLSAQAFIMAILGASLILVTVVDARQMIIPDEVTGPGLWIGLSLSFLVPRLHGSENRLYGLGMGLLGAVAGAGVIFAIGMAGKWVFRKKLLAIGEEEAIGGGDLKLMAMVGSLVGPEKALLVTLIAAPLLGSVVGLLMKARTGQHLIPYGPFLALATLWMIFWGDGLTGWYRGLFVY